MDQDHDLRSRAATRVTLLGIVANGLLSVGKLAAGVAGSSAAMVADGVHSVSDLATDLVVLVSLRIARAPEDPGHEYGHGKFETLAALFVGAALIGVAIGLAYSSVASIIRVAEGGLLPRPGMIALIAAAASILVKEMVFRLTRRTGRRIASKVLEANAWHHRSDALSSVGALLGIGLAAFLGPGFRILDPIAGLVISTVICVVAVRIIKDTLSELAEASVDSETHDRVLALAADVPGVTDPHRLRMRRVGSYVVLDLHVRMAGSISLADAHRLAHQVEDAITEELGKATIVTIHTEPTGSPDQ